MGDPKKPAKDENGCRPLRAAAYDCGANSHVVKPVDYEKFHQLVANVGYYRLVWNRPAA